LRFNNSPTSVSILLKKLDYTPTQDLKMNSTGQKIFMV